MRVVSDDLIPVLETAALRYAGMSLDEFDGDGCLRVSSSRMREMGLITTEVWAQVPAHDRVLVRRAPDGTLVARVLLPGLSRAPFP
jgi:hypothetical protein